MPIFPLVPVLVVKKQHRPLVSGSWPRRCGSGGQDRASPVPGSSGTPSRVLLMPDPESGGKTLEPMS
jgi:hypothetical protein